MNYAQFLQSLDEKQPPNIDGVLLALWHDARGDWHNAHEVVQDVSTREASLVHAYLHRKEGDLSNASYWYHRANEKMPQASLNDEWHALVKRFTQ